MKVSIVTPSFRNSDWLRLCVASVADQAGVEVEHIVQDALSDDGTQERLASGPASHLTRRGIRLSSARHSTYETD